MHDLLIRQLSKVAIDPAQLPESHRDLLQRISDTYQHGDDDRALLERSLEISSKEHNEIIDKLRRSEERFRKLIENSSELIHLIDNNQKIKFVSPSITKFLGYTQEEFVGKVAASFLHPEDLPIAQETFGKILHNFGASATSQFRIRHKDGHWVMIEAIGTNLLDDPQVGAIVVNSRDITERNQVELAIKQRTEELEKMNSLMVGRELKMVELKKKVAELENTAKNV